jgi:hypothetical protein
VQQQYVALTRMWTAQGVEELSLKTPKDFSDLAKELGGKMKKASSENVASFLTELLTKGAKDALEIDALASLIRREWGPPDALCVPAVWVSG